ncbi:putative ion channel [Xylogone sp. PMI_703]|nr:putative ion channel [Xylogone sp. PMI_703]
MPSASTRREDSRELLIQVGEFGETVHKRGRKMLDSFLDFVIQDNVLEVAMGLILAAGFTTIVTSFVSDILLPPISLLPFMYKNLDEKFAVIKKGPHFERHGYNTLKQAQDDGAVVMAYGQFLNKLLNFIGVGLALYLIATLYEYLSHDPVIKHTVKCKFCRKRISVKALRCVNCTSWQDGREEHVQT